VCVWGGGRRKGKEGDLKRCFFDFDFDLFFQFHRCSLLSLLLLIFPFSPGLLFLSFIFSKANCHPAFLEFHPAWVRKQE